MGKTNIDWRKFELELCETCKFRLDCLTKNIGECELSFIRNGHPLTWFKGESHSYVYLSEDGVVDYDDDYEDLATFIELIGILTLRQTDDETYANKIVKVLALRLGIFDQLRDQPLTGDEYLAMICEKANKVCGKVKGGKK